MTKKDVRIRIRSVLYEVEASLFSSDPLERSEFKPADTAPEPQILEINSVGELRIEDGRWDVRYDETEMTGMNGASTAVSFSEESVNSISMVREGSVSTVLLFEPNKRHHCVYNTPFMPFEVCVHTLHVDNKLDSEGTLDLDYVVEIRGAQAERTKFNMQILK